MHDTGFLYHYYEKSTGPFRTITSLPLRDEFFAIGGKPVRGAPVYFTLGANKGMETWYNNPACIKIPVGAFSLDTISFTYGDMFPVFNPELNTGEEWWGQVYDYQGILKLIDKCGCPEDPVHNLKNAYSRRTSTSEDI